VSRFRPERVPGWIKMTFLVVLVTVMRLVIIAYVLATIWLVATGRLEV
jgi:hypothetical protein